MLRAVNLVVEVFIDVTDDGTAYAEALMLHHADKRAAVIEEGREPPLRERTRGCEWAAKRDGVSHANEA